MDISRWAIVRICLPMKAIMYDLKISKVIRKRMKLAGKYTMIKYRSDWPKPSIKHPRQVLILLVMR
ncbi:MAG: hypothetical protein ACW979_08930 [Candidatus Thorarchaeota archaeon]